MVANIITGVKALTRETPVKTWDPETRKGSLNGTFKVLIAFALLERNESDEASSSSGRSSRVDMAQDTLDILRIHGIVQQFFVDNLADERLAHFWLERAICVFCRAFDESDNRIQQDSGTGMPEDYLRFHIHGQRLSIFLDRFEKKYPQLYGSREMLDARIDSIQLRIDQLNKRKKNMDNTSGEVQTVSVFERTGSLSEMDSSTPPSNSSLIDLPMYDEDNAPLESPRTYSPTDHNPHHWHVSFPYGMLPPDGVDISRTVTPQPPPTEIFDSISVPEDYEPHVQGTALDDHRTLRRHSERRYRDTAGAWRASPQILSDPRVSLSRETVRGVIPPVWQPEAGGLLNSSQTNRVVIRPGAELTLNNISRVSTLSVIGETPPKSEDHELPGDGRSPARPKFVPGQPSYSNAQTVTALDDDNPVPTFSNVMGTSPGASSSYTAATILRLGQSEKPNSTDGLAPIKVSSPLAAEPLTVSSLRPGQGPASAIESAMDLPDPTKLTQADSRRSSGQSGRGLRSSPTQYFGPFRPPPIPFEVNTTSSLRIAPGNAGGGARQTVSYGRVDQTSIFEDGAKYNLSTHSLPTVQPYAPGRPPSPPYPQPKAAAGPELAIHPPPWNSTDTRLEYAPQGYWSQPLSRDPSHQSSNSHGSARSHSARNRSPLVRSSSIQESSASSSPGPQTMQCPKSRRPSVVETEPSPRLGPAGFEVEPTSYQLYHDSTRGRRRAASGSIYPGQVFLHETTSRSGFPGRLNRHRDSADLSIPHRRAESAGGRLVRGGLESRGSPRRSPDLRGAGGVFTASTSMSGAAGGEGENMARSMSGSGGFKLADGSVVEFGMSPPMAGGRMGGSGDLGLGILD